MGYMKFSPLRRLKSLLGSFFKFVPHLDPTFKANMKSLIVNSLFKATSDKIIFNSTVNPILRARLFSLVWRWCNTEWFATTIFRATQRRNAGTMLQTFGTLLQQCGNAVLRKKSSLRIVSCTRCKEIHISESGIILFVQFGIVGFGTGNPGLWNPEFRSRNPKSR